MMNSLNKTPKISTCIIAQDCEETIEICLKSVRDFSNELIVVDGGSSDNTVNIAKRHADKVVYRKWPDNFADQRNYALKLSTNDWIFMIDSDEFVATDFGQKIQSFITEQPYIGYLFQRHWIVSGNPPGYLKGEKFEQVVTRLIHRKMFDSKEFSESIHEDLIHEYGTDVGGQRFAIARNLVIYHLCLLATRETREQKVVYYESIKQQAGASYLYLYEDFEYQHEPLKKHEIPDYAWNFMLRKSIGVTHI